MTPYDAHLAGQGPEREKDALTVQTGELNGLRGTLATSKECQQWQTIAERKPLNDRHSEPLGDVPAPSQIFDHILQLVFSYLSPVLRHACSAKELLTHWRSLQRVAAVNRQWRAAALPALYRAICVVIGDSQGMAASASDGDIIWLRSNISLFHAAGQTESAREVRIFVQGMGQTAGQLLRQLLLAGLGGGVVWPQVERLRIDMRDSSNETQTNAEGERGPEALQALNDFLSRALPSLREIDYDEYGSRATYHGVPIEQLIKERLSSGWIRH
ncbi:hypothetical protein GGF42_000455 [Coemansia sp. RSA 2424]|nr:hypothetical protein GGF42_000455 [Coemansia sp. RSA 2424]